MKKITLHIFSFLCLISTVAFGQTYSSGLFSFGGILDGQIDINTTTDVVTLTLIGNSSGWLAMGFDTNEHSSGKDVVIFTGTVLSDRSFGGGHSTPSVDGQQDWTVTSNTINGSTRTVVATRARDTGFSTDYVFSTSPTTLDIVVAYKDNFSISEHDDFNDTTVTFSLLGLEDFNKIQFSMYPNPATSNLEIVLPSQLNNASLEVFDVLGREIYSSNFKNKSFSIIDVSAWNSGVYLVKVSNNNSTQTKRFVKQ